MANDAASDDSAYLAHAAHVEAINSDNLDSLLSMLTEDVVFPSAHEPRMVGKAAVRPWLEGYVNAHKTNGNKPVQEFTVSGEWASERCSYESTGHPWVGNRSSRKPEQVWRPTIMMPTASGASHGMPGVRVICRKSVIS